MARHLVQLKRESLRGALRADSPDRQPVIASIVASVGIAVDALVVVAVLWNRSAELRGAVAVIVGTVALLAAFVVSAASHEDEPIDPRALVMAGRSPATAAREALVASMFGVAPAALAVVLLATIALWRDDLIALAFALVGAVVAFGLSVVLGRLGALVGSISNDRRVAGDVLSATGLVALLAASPLVFVLVTAPWQQGAGTVVQLVANALAWSPFGGAWAAPATSVAHGPLIASAQLALSIVGLVILLVVWQRLGERLAAGTLARRRSEGELDLGFVGRVGTSPAGAIAARIVTYWLRDRRYRVVLLAVALVPLLAIVPLALAGVPVAYLALVPVPLLAFFFGWALHNDLAYDSTALWIHITAAMDGRSDRWGRALPTLVVGTTLIVLGSVVTGLITGEWLWALSCLGVSLGLLGATAGISSVTSVLFPYAVARPGDSPYSQPVRSWGSGVWMHPVTGVAALVTAAPAVALGVVGIVTGQWWWHVAAFVVGVAIGAWILTWGVDEGGRRYAQRSSELMTFATSA